jgi:hypothetical protein
MKAGVLVRVRFGSVRLALAAAVAGGERRTRVDPAVAGCIACTAAGLAGTGSVCSSVTSGPPACRSANSSRRLISSQLAFAPSPSAPLSRTSDHWPCSRSPSSAKSSLPRFRPASTSPSGVQCPRSQMITWPAPYSPAGMSPLNVRYS